MSPAERRAGVRRRATAWLGALLAVLPALAPGAGRTPPAIRTFSPAAWQGMRGDPAHRRVVVFTTSDCVYCAAEVDALVAQLRDFPAPRPRVAVVVMDGRASAKALLQDGNFLTATEIWAFEGNETAMRYAIDPAWRGETPYLAFLPAGGPPWFALGQASARDLQLLRARRPR